MNSPAEASQARWIALGAILIGLALSGWAWIHAQGAYPDLPERIPVHFDDRGEPDGWREKGFASVYLLPFTGLLCALGLPLLGWAVGIGAERQGRPRYANGIALYVSVIAVL